MYIQGCKFTLFNVNIRKSRANVSRTVKILGPAPDIDVGSKKASDFIAGDVMERRHVSLIFVNLNLTKIQRAVKQAE